MSRDDSSAPPHVAFFLPHLGGGGTERMVATLANGLSARGYAVDIVLVSAAGTYLETLSKDIRVVDLGSRNSYLAFPRLIAYLRRRCPQVLVSALSLTNVLALIAARLAGSHARTAIRLESTVSAQRRTPWKKALEKPLLAAVYPWADRIIAVSRAVAEDAARYLSIPLARFNVVYNPVLGDQRAPVPVIRPAHPWFAEGCPPVILGVGRLVPVKDFPTLLRSFAEVRRRRDTHLIVLGEGDERAALLDLARQLHVAEDVQFPGFEPDSFSVMQSSQVFVLSSLYEGLPTALIEALASGCAVISTDCPGGAREILAAGAYGELVPVGDVSAMAAAIERALDGKRKPVDATWLDQFRLEKVLDETIRLLGLPALPG